jgi:hypothetical protein
MATVSGNNRCTQAALLLALVFNSACTALSPAQRGVDGAANASGPETDQQQVMTPGNDMTLPSPPRSAVGETGDRPQQVMVPRKDAPLPRQAYSDTGEKIPYVPQPNPYTSNAAPVPAEARSIFVVASSLQRQGNHKRAHSQLLKLTEKYPALSGAWVKLGSIEEINEKYDNAITHYRKAISVNKNNVNAYIALGLVQRRQGYFSDAQDTYLAALGIWRDFPEAHLNLAVLYDLYANMPEEAQKHYEAYYFLTGAKDVKAHKWLVEVKRRTGIDHSFIDTPPKEIAVVPGQETGDASVAVAAGGSRQE